MAINTFAAHHFKPNTLLALYTNGQIVGPQLSTLRVFYPHNFRAHHFRPVTLAGIAPQIIYPALSSRLSILDRLVYSATVTDKLVTSISIIERRVTSIDVKLEPDN